MTREIKFRAWDTMNEKILIVDEFHFNSGGEIYCIKSGEKFYYPGKTCELIQFTGLKDKNGKEIYEGDILQYIKVKRPKRGEKQYHVVEFSEHGIWIAKSIKVPSHQGRVWEMASTHEVIGNIYENKDLIK